MALFNIRRDLGARGGARAAFTSQRTHSKYTMALIMRCRQCFESYVEEEDSERRLCPKCWLNCLDGPPVQIRLRAGDVRCEVCGTERDPSLVPVCLTCLTNAAERETNWIDAADFRLAKTLIDRASREEPRLMTVEELVGDAATSGRTLEEVVLSEDV